MDIREQFLTYFAAKEHTINPSSPLIPDDASLLFVNAGMVPYKPIFTGDIPIPNPPRATSSQVCVRAGGKHNDLDNVGYTARHHTMFEMLGNFSFGDYFKEDAIKNAWEFLTDVLKLDKEKLWISVHDSDDEAEEIWKAYVPAEKIVRMGDKDNFWQMGDTGPCGPCSEIHYDQGAEHFNSEEDYFGGEGDRFLEIWNLVFMQYNRDSEGTLHPLPKPSIDTGMGLERITAIKEGVQSNYDCSLFVPLLKEVESIIDQPYEYALGASFRVIADHIRAVTFMLSNGVNFDKEGRGYVMRRILRRAIRHGYKLGMRTPFMYKLVNKLADINTSSYPELKERQVVFEEQIKLEEERFFKTIESGMTLFEEALKNTKEIFDGAVAFKLYDTYGFPVDLTEDMLREKDINLDVEGYHSEMNAQKARAKAAWKGSGDAQKEGEFKEALELHGENSFVGYNRTAHTTTILALFNSDFKLVDSLDADNNGWVMLKETPFYATSGGQAGDCGVITGATVSATEKFFGLNLSQIKANATLTINTTTEAIVDDSRNEITKHHSATHLMHAALSDILGDHVTQAGSLVEENRLRFDFSHPKALTAEELSTIEAWVNHKILNALGASTKEMSIDDAKNSGAKAQFGEKYGDTVRVVNFGNDSVEFCGGTHVNNTGVIGNFVITKESGVSAGVRRIEAICGETAYLYLKDLQTELRVAKEIVKNKDLDVGIKKLQEQIKTLKQEVVDALKAGATELKAEEINGITVIIETVSAGDIKNMIDEAKEKHEKLVIMLMQENGAKVKIAVGSKGCDVHAGNLLKSAAAALGGKGGGRPDFAQGGGTDASGIAEAKTIAQTFINENS
jgi:alanyl-tRNA synthetase